MTCHLSARPSCALRVLLLLAIAIAATACDHVAPDADLAATSGQSVTAEHPVSLIYADTYNYGCSSCLAGKAFIELHRLGDAQTVSIGYVADDTGHWTSTEAELAEVLYDGREIWVADALPGFGAQFAVRTIAGGHSYWDNNGGHNYRVRAGGLGGAGFSTVEAALGNGRNVVVRSAEVFGSEVRVQLLVRNLAFDKDVGAVLSFDGWHTSDSASATYLRSVGDIELWTLSVPIPDGAVSFHFAGFAHMAGSDNWDNNFQRDYACKGPGGVWTCYVRPEGV